MDTVQIINQLSKIGVDQNKLARLFGNAVSLKSYLRKKSGLEKAIHNPKFVKDFEDFMTAEENAKSIFTLIEKETTIKQVFVYPKKEHLEILEKIESVLVVDEETKSKLKPTWGEVCVVEKGKFKSESWQNLDWEKEGQLIEIAGIVGPNGCFFPFERPTNGTVSLEIILDRNYSVNCIGNSTHFDKLHDIYSLIIGKFIVPGYRIKPIFFYDIRPAKCESEMQDYIKLWYNIFKNKRSKELYGHEKPNTDAKVEEIISMIKKNKYGTGGWNEDPIDYLWQSDNATRNLAVAHSNYTPKSSRQQRGSTFKGEKFRKYNIWRCK
jgi:hypothetical protein